MTRGDILKGPLTQLVPRAKPQPSKSGWMCEGQGFNSRELEDVVKTKFLCGTGSVKPSLIYCGLGYGYRILTDIVPTYVLASSSL